MKNFLISILLIVILLFTYLYRGEIINYIVITLFSNSYASEPNEYTVNTEFTFVKNTDKTIPYNKQEMLDIFYTNLNHGSNIINIICPFKYTECVDDAKNILYDTTLLSSINNYVHPFNSYKELQVSTNELGQIEIVVNPTYTKEEIRDLNIKVNEILTKTISPTMSDREKILAIHNYIIRTTEFDKEKSDNINNQNFIDKYKSGTAYGALINNYAICAGYTDAMSLFLDIFEIPNYRVASEKHIWNYVYIENRWYHLDLTWDDQDHSDKMLKTYFLITTKDLEKINDGAHVYKKNYFPEAS